MPRRASFANFDALFDTSPDAMVVVDSAGRIVLANAQAARLFGYSIEELGTLGVEALVPPKFRAGHEKHRTDYVAHARVRPMGSGRELAGLRADGTQFPVEIALSPIETTEGSCYVASIRDISETHRARQALIRARYDALAARIGRLMLESSGSYGAFDDIPKLIAEAAGFDAVAIVFTSAPGAPDVRAAHGWNTMLDDALPHLLRPEVLAAAGAASVSTARDLADDEARAAWRHLADAGSGDLALVPLFDRAQPMGALIAVAGDGALIGQEKIHLLQSVAYLLASDAQRSRTEEQLAHAQRLDAVGQLTGGIAHDFNNLLTVISGNLQLLEPDLADRPDHLEILGSAMRAVTRGAELTRKLLAVARRQRLNPQAIDPRKLFDELIPMLARTLGETIKMVVETQPGLPDVFVDPGELDTAILNLALNARDAMPRGGTLTIGARAKALGPADAGGDLTAGDYVVLSVRDTGLGMSPEVLARAFEPFFTTKETSRGSGLGLSMVYGFAKQSGGHLTAESRLGYGTRMELYLPAIESSPVHVARMAAPSSGGGETILVVEDEAEVRKIAVAFLHSLGYRTYAVSDAEQALDLLARHDEVSLLFSDVILGSGMDGVELARAVGKLRPGLPTLLTSGYEHPALPAGDMAAEKPALLPKPYRREELGAAVRRAIDGRESREA
jgi:PAS domain S-box-containing protein